MAKTQVMREITIEVCDFCQEECEHAEQCGVCKRVGHSTHMGYSIEVFRYRDKARVAGYGGHICQECETTPPTLGTIGALFDRIIGS